MERNLGEEAMSLPRTPFPEPLTNRLFDFALAAFGFVLSFPLWVLISAAIYLEDGRPCSFRSGLENVEKSLRLTSSARSTDGSIVRLSRLSPYTLTIAR